MPVRSPDTGRPVVETYLDKAAHHAWRVEGCFDSDGGCAAFFFQAEDGIRDTSVTGVQTWSLPISAKKAATYGIATAIVSGERPGHLTGLFQGDPVGTIFLPKSQKLTSRKHWIGYTVKAKGRLDRKSVV